MKLISAFSLPVDGMGKNVASLILGAKGFVCQTLTEMLSCYRCMNAIILAQKLTNIIEENTFLTQGE